MAKFVEITFNQELAGRFKNLIGLNPVSAPNGNPAAINNLDRATIEPVEVFDGNGSGKWDNNSLTYIQIATNTKFNFGNGLEMYTKMTFMHLVNGRYGMMGRRTDENNRWHVILDTTTPTTPTLLFYANDGGVMEHNLSLNFAAAIPLLTLGKWHTLEMGCKNNLVRFWIDGVFIGKSTAVGTLVIDAGGAPMEIGRVNQAATASPADFKGFDRYLDSVIFEDTSTAYQTDTDHYIRTWTGNTERLELFGGDKVPQPTILDQSKFPNNIPAFELASNQCFIAGIDPMRKVIDNVVQDVGMLNPGTVNFSAGSNGSNYDYVVTWVDARGNESGPSPVSVTRTTTANTVTRPTSPPAQATHWRVYRRNVTAGQGLHFLVSPDVPVATTSWAEANVVESLVNFAPLQGVTQPPVSNYVAYNAGRMFYGHVRVGGTKYPTRVYFSPINELEQVGPNDWFYVGDNDSEIITGLKRFAGNLVIFKENSIYVALGDPSDPGFRVPAVTQSVGCVAHQTIQEVDNRLIWMDDEGVWVWRGDREPVLVSGPIEPFFANMPNGRKPFASASVDKDLGFYLLTLSIDDEDENDYVLCYNYRESFMNNPEDEIHKWTRWRIHASSLASGYIGDGREPRSFFADKQGRIGLFEPGLDLQKGIDFKWKSGRFNPWHQGSGMIVRYLTTGLDFIGEGKRRVSVGYEIEELGEQLTNFVDPLRNNLKIRVGARGDFISVIISGIDIRNPVRLYNFDLDGGKIGRR